MFGFLGGKSHRKRQTKATGKNQRSAVAAAPSPSAGKPSTSTSASSKKRRPPNNDDRFLENSSVDMSLYTTPSKATIQYHRGGHRHQFDWKSQPDGASLFSSEVAAVQSKLGGWQTATDTNGDPGGPRSGRAIRNGQVLVPGRYEDSSPPNAHATDRSLEDDDGSLFIQQSATKRVYERVSQLAPMRNFEPTKPTATKPPSGATRSRPVDVDSVSVSENDDETTRDEDSDSVSDVTFSDVFSNFEAQSLAGRIAPATAASERGRGTGMVLGSMTAGKVSDDGGDGDDASDNVSFSLPPSQNVRGDTNNNSIVTTVSSASSGKPHIDSKHDRSKSGKRESNPAGTSSSSRTSDQLSRVSRSSYVSSREGLKSASNDTGSSNSVERPSGDHHSQKSQSSRKSSGSTKQQQLHRSARSESTTATALPNEKILSPETSKTSRSASSRAYARTEQKTTSSIASSGWDESIDLSRDASESMEDISFSGLFSTCEAESLAGRLAPAKVYAPGQLLGKTIQTAAASTRTERFLYAADDLSNHPDDSSEVLSGVIDQVDSESDVEEEVQPRSTQGRAELMGGDQSAKSASSSHGKRSPHQQKQVPSVDETVDIFSRGSDVSASKPGVSKGETDRIEPSAAQQGDLRRLTPGDLHSAFAWDRQRNQSGGSADASVYSSYSASPSEGVVLHAAMDEMSFSGLLSKFEESSRVNGWEPSSKPIPGEMIGMTVQTDSNNSSEPAEEPCASRSVSSEQSSGLRSNRSRHPAAGAAFDPTELQCLRPVVGTLSNATATSTSNFLSDTSSSETTSLPTSEVKEKENFAGILSRFEAQSLSDRLAPPAPRRLIGTGIGTTSKAVDNSSPIFSLNWSTVPGSEVGPKARRVANDSQNGKISTENSSNDSATPALEYASDVSEHPEVDVSSFRSAMSLDDDQSTLPLPPSPQHQQKVKAEPYVTASSSPSGRREKTSPPRCEMSTDISFSRESKPCMMDSCSFSTIAGDFGALNSGGPIDLDDVDSSSETSSFEDFAAYGDGSRSAFAHLSTTSATTPTEHLSRKPESYALQMDTLQSNTNAFSDDEDDDQSPIVWADHDHDDEDDAHGSGVHRGESWCQADEEVLDRSFNETMESITFSTRDMALQKYSPHSSNLLTEDELIKHTKSTESKEPLPSSCIQGYDSWKTQREMQQRYFARIHEQAMKRKNSTEGAGRRQPKVSARQSQGIDSCHRTRDFCLSPSSGASTPKAAFDSTQSIMEVSMSSTIPTVEGSHAIPRHKKLSQRPKRGWNFLGAILQKSDEGMSSVPRMKHQKKSQKNKREPSVVALDHFMRISSDEPEDVDGMSLAPLIEFGSLTVGTVVPTGDTFAATRSHCLDPLNFAEGNPRQLALENLEKERQKQRLAERDRDKAEQREQQRMSFLKNRELERQRRLNRDKRSETRVVKSKRDEAYSAGTQKSIQERSVFSGKGTSRDPITVSTAKDTASLESLSHDPFLNKDLSFDLTVPPNIGLTSPTSVTHLTPCVVCKLAERTHLSMPCMHFSFCQDCVSELHRLGNPACPVCKTKNIAFSRVYT